MAETGINTPNPLRQLAEVGQAFWYDNIRRQLLEDGSLKKLVDDDGLRGVTANPTIFEQAIAAGTDYDQEIRALVEQGADANAIYERLATDDVRSACDILRPVYDATHGQDGYVSLEVSPLLARDTAGTISEVKRFWQIVGRPNLMVKIPATREGLPAIQQSLSDGININITLIFAVERYIEVAHAYVEALRQRVQRGEPVDRMASVASFFVSRVDTKVDKLLDEKLAQTTSDADRRELESLKGKAAIANAKVAYERFKEIFYGAAFADLKAKGARVQRPLWASTSTKNPAYSDVMYVEELIGPDTVDTMPPKTIDAFRDHGKVQNTLEAGIDETHDVLERLARAGIDMQRVTRELEEEGVESFAKSLETLADGINAKRDALLAHFERSETASLGGLQARVDEALADAAENRVAARIAAKDATLWKPQTKANDPEISGWLGWLTAPEVGLEALDDLERFVEQVRAEGFTDAVVLGMGGSSLAPEVFAQTFGQKAGYPRLQVLDSTDPANVLGIASDVDLAHTLFMVSSKSGTTTEPNDYFAYFWDHVQQSGAAEPGRQFVAITDKGTPLDKLGQERGFRRVFRNDPTIGGRYSALSFFGLVPAALAGVALRPLLERARAMGAGCGQEFTPTANPGVWLGTVMGEAAKAGHDKITIVCSPSLGSFGLWAEQLLAESTGKEGTGLIPIAGEEIGEPGAYGNDRLFIYVHVKSDGRHALDAALKALEKAGQPVVRLELGETLDLGAEFMRWEFATAVAGAILGINPFDQPNVQESKDNTNRLLAEFQEKGRLPQPAATAHSGAVTLVGGSGAGGTSVEAALRAFLRQVKPGDYVAIMAYLPYDASLESDLQDHRLRLRNVLKVATTFGYGPRFLHSTGQLHKGGPNSGVFIQITHTSEIDAPVPGKPYSFAVLEEAQALGDLQSLQQHGRRAIGLRLEGDLHSGIEVLASALETAQPR